MSDAQSTMDELSTLRREVAELKERRKFTGKVEADEADEAEKKPLTDPVAEDGKDEVGSGETDEHDIVEQLEKYLKEIEEAARERPALVLLATFAVGVVVGQIFSRK